MVRQTFQNWLQRRLPRTDTWLLTQRNVFILPTRAGLAFALTLVLMLVASINYQLNLGYLLTFLLAGAGAVSMHITHATLRGLTLHMRPAAAVFAGDALTLEVVLSNPGGQRHAITLHFQQRPGSGRSSVNCDVPAQGQEVTHLSLVPAARGWHDVPALVVETSFPFGLFRAWTQWRPAGRVLAWPRPEQPAPPLPAASPVPGQGRQPQRAPGGELDGVRLYRRGDSMRQVVWKKVARSGQLVSRDTTSTASQELWLDWVHTPGTDAERRLARLSAWVQAADRSGLAYGLRLPGRDLAPDQGDGHRRAALDLLATW
jgi:uncharacterized protein (DUF58 family)